MESTGLNGRFSRQTILPGVGVEGQKKWGEAEVVLAGEGAALEAAQTALERVGLSRIHLLTPQTHSWPSVFSAGLIVTSDPEWRRRLSRQVRPLPGKFLFAWAGVSVASFFLTGSHPGSCPCLECFEVMNPKVFSSQGGSAFEKAGQRILGAMAATEVLQWILKGESPLQGKVWMASFEEGRSFQHEVSPSDKCPAFLAEKGAVATP